MRCKLAWWQFMTLYLAPTLMGVWDYANTHGIVDDRYEREEKLGAQSQGV